jgi:hypothetical protein
LDDFCEWRDSFCISTAGSKIIRDNEESIRTLLNCSDPTIDLAFYFITEMLAYYYKVSKSQKLEQLEKVLEYAFSFYNKMPSGPTKKALSLKISDNHRERSIISKQSSWFPQTKKYTRRRLTEVH